MTTLTDRLKQVANSEHRKRSSLTIAQVMLTDSRTNTATIAYTNPRTGAVKTVPNVGLDLGAGVGVAEAGPFPGDQVLVAFLDEDETRPYIISRVDEDYNLNSRELSEHSRSGAMLSTEGSIGFSLYDSFNTHMYVPSHTTWMDTSSVNVARYMALSAFDVTTVEDEVSAFGYYDLAEVGFTHPVNQSTVKVYNSGAIDIFTATGAGIRVDPAGSSIFMNSENECHSANMVTYDVSSNMVISAQSGFSVNTSTMALSASGTIGIAGSSLQMGGSTRVDLFGPYVTVDGQTKLTLKGETVEMASAQTSLDSTESLTVTAPEISISGDQVRIEGTDKLILKGLEHELEYDAIDVASKNVTYNCRSYRLLVDDATFDLGDGVSLAYNKHTISLLDDIQLVSGLGEVIVSDELTFSVRDYGLRIQEAGVTLGGSDHGLTIDNGITLENDNAKVRLDKSAISIQTTNTLLAFTSNTTRLESLSVNLEGHDHVQVIAGRSAITVQDSQTTIRSPKIVLDGDVEMDGESFEDVFDRLMAAYIVKNKAAIISTLDVATNTQLSAYATTSSLESYLRISNFNTTHKAAHDSGEF